MRVIFILDEGEALAPAQAANGLALIGWEVESVAVLPRYGQASVLAQLQVEGNPEEMSEIIAEALTRDDGDLRESWAPDTWGGYEGPFIVGVQTVTDKGHVSESNWMIEREEES